MRYCSKTDLFTQLNPHSDAVALLKGQIRPPVGACPAGHWRASPGDSKSGSARMLLALLSERLRGSGVAQPTLF
jgi:hypothetical protein